MEILLAFAFSCLVIELNIGLHLTRFIVLYNWAIKMAYLLPVVVLLLMEIAQKETLNMNLTLLVIMH